jgi:hypothetical protein|tara:strand:- start:527 stop:835 length:309 start_codon:yes stop_codon:yes gene_type:complete
MGVTMKCYYHPSEMLEHSEVPFTKYDGIETIHDSYDVAYCPKCFEEHANIGSPMKMRLVPKHHVYQLNNDEIQSIANDRERVSYENSIDHYIDTGVNERRAS